MKKYTKLLLIIINLNLPKLYCNGQKAGDEAELIFLFKEMKKIENIEGITDENGNSPVVSILFMRSADKDGNINITRFKNDINNVKKYFPNKTFKKNYDALLNVVDNEHKNEAINEIINNLDIYGDIFSDEEIDIQKLKEIFELIKNYDFKEHPTAREIFKAEPMKKLLKNLPTNLSKRLVEFLEWAYKQWMKTSDAFREPVERYISNAIKNFFRNTGLEKLLEDPGKIVEAVKNNEEYKSIKNSLTKIFKEMVDAEKEKKYVEENYKNIKPIKILLKNKKEFETVRNMFESKKFTQGLKKIGKDTIEVISCKKCAQEIKNEE